MLERGAMITGLDYSATLSRVHRVLPVERVTFWPVKGVSVSQEVSKPEWFQMADADDIPPVQKSRRFIRIMALASPLLVLGGGLVFAQTQNAPLDTATATASTAVAGANSSTPAVTTQPITQRPQPKAAPTLANNRLQISQPSTSAVAVATNISISKPGIKFPTGGDDQIIRTSDDE